MAVATIVQDNERFDLKSCPPDGYVVIRRMNWQEKLKRQGMMTKFHMQFGTKKGEDTKAEVDFLQEQVSQWEFQNLIVEHNLTDHNKQVLNFKNIADINRLDPRAGEEIQSYIDKINSFDEDDDIKN